MTYLELMEMRKKYIGNAMITALGVCIFFLIVNLIVSLGVAFFNPFLAVKLADVMTIVVLASIVPVIPCAIRIYLYLTDEMKKARMKEAGIRD